MIGFIIVSISTTPTKITPSSLDEVIIDKLYKLYNNLGWNQKYINSSPQISKQKCCVLHAKFNIPDMMMWKISCTIVTAL